MRLTYNKERPSEQLVQNFLKQRQHFQLFQETICHPSPENQRRLNDAFQDYYAEVHLTQYITQTLSRYAKDFLAKEKTGQNHYLLTLDKPVPSNKYGAQPVTYEERLSDEGASVEFKLEKRGRLLDHIENRKLYEGLKELTDRQFMILNLHFFYNLAPKEIASRLGITKQAVSKTLRQALSKLRSHFEEGENHGSLD